MKTIAKARTNRLKVSIYGIGNFGYALLKQLSGKAEAGDISLRVYDAVPDVRVVLRETREHLNLHKGVKISRKVVVEKNAKELVAGADILVLAVSSDAIKAVVAEIRPHLTGKLIIVNTAKALDAATGKRPSALIAEGLKGSRHPVSIAMLSGGTIARDLFFAEPLGIDIASEDASALELLRDVFTADNLNVYVTDDLAGVEYAAAFKSVVAILAGVMKGLKFSYGSETHVISRLAGEIERLVVGHLGGQARTFAMDSQCWGNDMLMSATGNTRNREFGVRIGEGGGAREALRTMKAEHKTVEGIHTVRAITKLAARHGYRAPLLAGVSDIVLKGKDARKTILRLMKANRM